MATRNLRYSLADSLLVSFTPASCLLRCTWCLADSLLVSFTPASCLLAVLVLQLLAGNGDIESAVLRAFQLLTSDVDVGFVGVFHTRQLFVGRELGFSALCQRC